MKMKVELDEQAQENFWREWAVAKFPGFNVDDVNIPSGYSSRRTVEIELESRESAKPAQVSTFTGEMPAAA